MIVATIIIISIICPIALISMIVTASNKKNKDDIASAEHSIRNIYLYTLLIITLFAIIFCSIYALRIGLDILLPEKITSTYYYSDKLQKNENIVNLFTTISIIAIAIPLFIKHSKLANELKK